MSLILSLLGLFKFKLLTIKLEFSLSHTIHISIAQELVTTAFYSTKPRTFSSLWKTLLDRAVLYHAYFIEH